MRIPRVFGVYTIIHLLTDKFYVGSSYDLYERFIQHRGDLRSGIHKNKQLQELYNLDSELEFHYEECNDREEAYKKEQELLDIHHGSDRCVNVLNDAKMSWKKGTMPKELAAKMNAQCVAANLARTYPLGAKRTEETKRRMREAQQRRDPASYPKGLKRSEEFKAAARIFNSRPRAKGQIFTDDHRGNMKTSAIARGITLSRNVSLDGVIYDNAGIAAIALGVTRKTIMDRIKSDNPKYEKWVQI